MQIVRDLAGYSLGRSDLLRRAMSKKKADVMNKEREIFLHGDGEEIKGCIKNGIDEATANQIFDDMMDFAKYAFNKSHAAAYAVVAYQTAYLKTYYKVEFMAALMTSVMENTSKITGYMETCKKMNIKVLPPDINQGFSYFDAHDNEIIFGLAAIKNVGKNVVERIVEEREKGGKFKSLTEFYNRMESKDTNKRSIESLILSGAFDLLGGKRSQYMAVYKQIADSINHTRKNNIVGQIDLFGMDTSEKIVDEDHLPNIPEFDTKELLAYEKEVLGIYLSGHPLDKVRGELEEIITTTSNQLDLSQGQLEDSSEGAEGVQEDTEVVIEDGKRVVVGGILVDKKVIFTKNNNKMAFITLEDLMGTMEIVIFPNIYEKFADYNEESIFLISGRVSIKEETHVVILAEKIITLDEYRAMKESKKTVVMSLDETLRTPEIRNKLLEIFKVHPGGSPVVVKNASTGEVKKFPSKYNVHISPILVEKLINLLGEGSVTIMN